MKGIDAVSRQQTVQLMSALGVGNSFSIINSMVPAVGPLRPTVILPTVTEEDRIILNNVQKVVEFLTAGTSKSMSTTSQVIFECSFTHYIK